MKTALREFKEVIVYNTLPPKSRMKARTKITVAKLIKRKKDNEEE